MENTDTVETRQMDIRQVLKALPHRYPLLLVDRVESLTLNEEIHAVKAVTFNEEFFQGHFPGAPAMARSPRSTPKSAAICKPWGCASAFWVAVAVQSEASFYPLR